MEMVRNIELLKKLRFKRKTEMKTGQHIMKKGSFDNLTLQRI